MQEHTSSSAPSSIPPAEQQTPLLSIAWLCRRSVPLAIALLHVSEPSIGAVDTLSRLSHDADSEVAQNALVALGKCLFMLWIST